MVGKYRGYNPAVNPNIPVEFSTASFRIGHPLIVDNYPMRDRSYKIYTTFPLSEVFFNPGFMTSGRISDVFRGLSRNHIKEKSEEIVNSVRNLLVLDPGNREIKLDLFSLNLQRARDHGLGSYNTVRQAFGLPRVQTFEQIVKDTFRASKLRFVY